MGINTRGKPASLALATWGRWQGLPSDRCRQRRFTQRLITSISVRLGLSLHLVVAAYQGLGYELEWVPPGGVLFLGHSGRQHHGLERADAQL